MANSTKGRAVERCRQNVVFNIDKFEVMHLGTRNVDIIVSESVNLALKAAGLIWRHRSEHLQRSCKKKE